MALYNLLLSLPSDSFLISLNGVRLYVLPRIALHAASEATVKSHGLTASHEDLIRFKPSNLCMCRSILSPLCTSLCSLRLPLGGQGAFLCRNACFHAVIAKVCAQFYFSIRGLVITPSILIATSHQLHHLCEASGLFS
jgi:hypothetical protein